MGVRFVSQLGLGKDLKDLSDLNDASCTMFGKYLSAECVFFLLLGIPVPLASFRSFLSFRSFADYEYLEEPLADLSALLEEQGVILFFLGHAVF